METQNSTLILEQRESIKLMKMSKGYNWELKILTQGEGIILDSLDIKRLEELDKQMKEKWGEKDE